MDHTSDYLGGNLLVGLALSTTKLPFASLNGAAAAMLLLSVGTVVDRVVRKAS